MLACGSGDRTEVIVGWFDGSAESTPESVPMLRICRDGLVQLRSQPGHLVSTPLTADDLRFVHDALRSISAKMTRADDLREPTTSQTYWSPSGALRLDALIRINPDSLLRYLDLTVGTAEHGALRTLPMGRSEAEQSVNSFRQDSGSIVLYGRFCPPAPA